MEISQPRASKQYTDLHRGKSFEELVQLAITELTRKKSFAPWDLGDLAITVSTRAESAKQEDGRGDLVAAFLSRTGMSQKAFMNDRWLSLTFSEPEVRNLGVSWTHFRLAAGTDDPVATIKKAVEEGWSTRQLEEYIRHQKGNQPVRAAPDVHLCAICEEPISGAAMFTLSGPFGTESFDKLACLHTFVKRLVEQQKGDDLGEDELSYPGQGPGRR